ncbi:hypothetical protein [Oceanobacillus sp. J11TS1]|uniref:hypothetical protein n=1 Tax=Oceanobacillus sp. J11TS1 TaxID=2807191 RepID=UPI001B11E3F9|nr:hypothetical protein [Oceanobacillus sp. J11TS1]GIO25085.1 hypothetical protein J11TS1_36660 [Oceanobacillus sp. J11TS1]
MPQKIIGTQWNRETRNAINDNDTELFRAVNNISGKITDEIYSEIRNDVKLNWKEPVNTVADLPPNAQTGDTRMIRETVNGVSPIYRYNGLSWVEIQQINSTAITEVDQRLQAEINKRETPEGAQAKANAAKDSAIKNINDLEKKIYNDADEVVKVVEKGSNANGEYIRYSDGTQYCWAEPFAQTAMIKAGGLWRSELRDWTYPKPFAKRPVSISAQALSYARWADISGRPSLTSASIYQYGYAEGTNAYTTAVFAFGWWK